MFQDDIGLNEWAHSLRTAHKLSLELYSSMNRKAGQIYGTSKSDDKNSKGSPKIADPQLTPVQARNGGG